MRGRHRWMHWVLRESAEFAGPMPFARGKRMRRRPAVMPPLHIAA